MSVVGELELFTRGKKVLILGFGREGQSTLAALLSHCHPESIGIADRNEIQVKLPSSVLVHSGSAYLEYISAYDIIFCAPGIPIHKEAVHYFTPKQCITSQTDIILRFCSKKTVGITGTKGKSTTSTLIYKLLESSGKTATLVGNMGSPAFNQLEEIDSVDVILYELSSHQLTTATKSPHIAVVLNLFPEHLDYYASKESYYAAKAEVFRHQNALDFLVVNRDDAELHKLVSSAVSNKLYFSHLQNHVAEAWFDNTNIYLRTKSINLDLKRGRFQLLGDINVSNIMASLLVVSLVSQMNEENIASVLECFSGLPHRIESIGTYKGIQFINDAISTTPDTTCAAIAALGSRVNTLILGGQDRPIDIDRYRSLAAQIKSKQVENLIFIHQNGPKLKEILHVYLGELNYEVKEYFAGDMPIAVQKSYQVTNENSICLLSPAAPSFGAYKDYAERGAIFSKAVHKQSKNEI